MVEESLGEEVQLKRVKSLSHDVIVSVEGTHRYTIGGWFSKWKVSAKLFNAKPGAEATVWCKSDAEGGHGSKITIKADDDYETVRGCTTYLSRYMDVKFIDCTDPSKDVVVKFRCETC